MVSSSFSLLLYCCDFALGTNAHDYVATGGFSDISAVAYNTTFNNLPFRACWDDSVVEIRTVEVDPVPRVYCGEEDVPRASASSRTGRSVETSEGDAAGNKSSQRSNKTAVHDVSDGIQCPPSLSCPSHSPAAASGPRAHVRSSSAGLPREDNSGPHASGQTGEGRRSVDGETGRTWRAAPGGSDFEEVIYWRVKLPWPLQDRDFVYARRFRLYAEKRAIVAVQQATESVYCPESPQAVRVDRYNSTVVLFADNPEKDLEKKGVAYVVYHFDASK